MNAVLRKSYRNFEIAHAPANDARTGISTTLAINNSRKTNVTMGKSW